MIYSTKTDIAPAVLVFLAVIVVAIFVAIIPDLSQLITVFGNRLGYYSGSDLVLDYTKGVLWAFFLGITILFWPVAVSHKRAIIFVWALKCAIALGFMLVYEAQYGIDLDGHYGISAAENYGWSGFDFGNGTHNIRQLCWLHGQVLPESFHATKISFAMIGLIALYLFYRASVLLTNQEDLRYFYIIGIYPSILIWSSLLGKDPVVLLGMAVYALGVAGWCKSRQAKYTVLVIAGTVFASYFRTVFGFIMLMPFTILILRSSRGRFGRIFMSIFLITLAFGFKVSLQNRYSLASTTEVLDFRESIASGFSNNFASGLTIHEAPDVTSLLMIAPLAAFTALFRPLPWEAHNLFAFVLSLENLLLIFVTLRIILLQRFVKFLEPRSFWLLMVIGLWAGFYGVFVYNLGALSRFKLQILPFIIGFLLLQSGYGGALYPLKK